MGPNQSVPLPRPQNKQQLFGSIVSVCCQSANSPWLSLGPACLGFSGVGVGGPWALSYQLTNPDLLSPEPDGAEPTHPAMWQALRVDPHSSLQPWVWTRPLGQ